MKTAVITVLLAVLASNASPVSATTNYETNGRLDTVSVVGPVTEAENAAQYPGGEQELERYVRNHIQYPRIAKEQGIVGKVIVAVVISETGNITDIEVIQGIGGGCDEEVVRVLSEMPAWKPGKQDGTNVKAQKIFSFNFQL